jgi:hypothetical protein
MPTVALWQAVALVLDIDPLSLERQTDKGMAGHGPWPSFRARSFPSKAKRVDFDRAISLAELAANFGGPIRLEVGGYPIVRNKRTAKVSLAETAAFFASLDWPDIPPALLVLVEPAGDSVEPPKPETPPASVVETAKQRRSRLLQMFDAEVSAGGKLGALARVTKIEKRTRPTADRSNIGKDIRRAREERDAERRWGALTRGLG